MMGLLGGRRAWEGMRYKAFCEGERYQVLGTGHRGAGSIWRGCGEGVYYAL